MLFGRPVLLLFVLSAGACKGSLAPNETRVIGNIEASGNEEIIQAPSTVHSGEEFTVTVATFGSSCVRASGAEIATNGATVIVTPYDAVRDGTCLEYRKAYLRSVKVQFNAIGTDTLRVRGRNDRGDIITIDRLVEVTPAVILG